MQIIDSVPSDRVEPIICYYVNATNHIQIARITNIPNWYFERVVFPGQRLVFEALPEAHLEIHTGMMASAILSDTLPCDRLQLMDPPTPLRSEPEAGAAQVVPTPSIPTQVMPTQLDAPVEVIQTVRAS